MLAHRHFGRVLADHVFRPSIRLIHAQGDEEVSQDFIYAIADMKLYRELSFFQF